MQNLVVKIANLHISFNYEYNLIKELSNDYIVDEYDHIDIELNDINVDKYASDNRPEVAEVLAILDSMANNVFRYDILLVHGAAIEYKEKAYLFMAPSGTGKTTHIKYWKQVLNDVGIINGDKPLIDSNGTVYGTPFSGKERWNKPVSYKLDCIIFIYRDEYNHIEKVNCQDCIQDLLNCVNLPNGKEFEALNLVNTIFKDIRMYKMHCINDVSAAQICINEVLKNED